MNLDRIYLRRWFLLYTPVFAIGLIVIALGMAYISPLPPRQVTFVAGAPGGTTTALSQRYSQRLERMGIELHTQVTTSAGASLAELNKAGPSTRFAFAPGVSAHQVNPNEIQALSVIAVQPLWVFTKSPNVQRIADLQGKRIGVSPDDSVNAAAKALLEVHGVAEQQVQMKSLLLADAAAALTMGELDAVIALFRDDSPTLRSLARSPDVRILPTEQLNELTHKMPTLYPMLLSQGAIELRGNVPPADTFMAVSRSHLVVRSDMHPALQRALIEAVASIHDQPSAFYTYGQYPHSNSADFKLSPSARAAALGDRPYLETIFPYYTAQLFEQLLFFVIPVIIVAGLVILSLKQLLSKGIDKNLQIYYGQLKFIENQLSKLGKRNPDELALLVNRIERLDRKISAMSIPPQFASRWYTLRVHLAHAKERITAQNTSSIALNSSRLGLFDNPGRSELASLPDSSGI